MVVILWSHLIIFKQLSEVSGYYGLDLIRSQRASDSPGSSRCYLTRLGTRREVPADAPRLAHVLLVASTVRVIHGVHRNTSNSGPFIALSLVLVEGSTRLHDGLVSAATTSNETDHGAAAAGHGLLRAGREADTRGVFVLIMRDDDSIVTRSPSHLSAVSDLGLNIADDGTLGDISDGKDVSNSQLSLLAGVDELASEQSLRGRKQSVHLLESVGVPKLYASDGSTTTLVMEDLTDNAFDIALKESRD